MHPITTKTRPDPVRAKLVSGNLFATPEDLLWLSVESPALAVQHANCPEDIWWQLAKTVPWHAMNSVLFPILTLEAPERWEQLQRENVGEWVEQAAKRLPFRERELFAADCAERVLYLYEQVYPGDKGARDTIVARRCYALGQISEKEWEGARYKASKTAHLIRDNSYSAAPAAYYAILSTCNARSAYFASCLRTADACYTERLWQWEQLQKYLQEEVE